MLNRLRLSRACAGGRREWSWLRRSDLEPLELPPGGPRRRAPLCKRRHVRARLLPSGRGHRLTKRRRSRLPRPGPLPRRHRSSPSVISASTQGRATTTFLDPISNGWSAPGTRRRPWPLQNCLAGMPRRLSPSLPRLHTLRSQLPSASQARPSTRCLSTAFTSGMRHASRPKASTPGRKGKAAPPLK